MITKENLDDLLKYNTDLKVPQFINRWKKFGDKEKESVFRFFCYYTVFNFLYNNGQETYLNCPENKFLQELKLEKDKCQICDTVFCIIGDDKDFNPFNRILKRDSELVNTPVDNTWDLKIIFNDCSITNIQKLFLNIYRIRCNLYHGSKEMRGYRDRAIVKEAADVLEYFLLYVLRKYDMREDG